LASMLPDHFPLLVSLRLGLGHKTQGSEKKERYCCKGARQEGLESFDIAVAGLRVEVRAASTVEEDWGLLREGGRQAMARQIPVAARPSRRPWIREGTAELAEHRKALAKLGLVGEARSLDRMVRDSAREESRA